MTEGKCPAHDDMVSGVATNNTNILTIKANITAIFTKLDRQFSMSVVIVILLGIVIGEKLLPYLVKTALAAI